MAAKVSRLSYILRRFAPGHEYPTIRYSLSDGIFAASSAPRISNSRLLIMAGDGAHVNGAAFRLSPTASLPATGVWALITSTPANHCRAEELLGHSSGPYDNSNVDGHNLLNAAGQGDKVE